MGKANGSGLWPARRQAPRAHRHTGIVAVATLRLARPADAFQIPGLAVLIRGVS